MFCIKNTYFLHTTYNKYTIQSRSGEKIKVIRFNSEAVERETTGENVVVIVIPFQVCYNQANIIFQVRFRHSRNTTKATDRSMPW